MEGGWAFRVNILSLAKDKHTYRPTEAANCRKLRGANIDHEAP